MSIIMIRKDSILRAVIIIGVLVRGSESTEPAWEWRATVSPTHPHSAAQAAWTGGFRI